MFDEEKFLGETIKFWLELKRRADHLQVIDLLRDLALANAKVAYYERLIQRMLDYRKVVEEEER